jgi:hypothetical protein
MGVYSFLDVQAAITGPGGAFSLSDGGVAGEGISITRTGDKSSMMIGAGGQGMHSLHASKAGRVSVRFLKTGRANAMLSKLYNQQTSSSAYHGQNTITIRNPVTGDSVTCRECAFVKMPDNVNATDGGVLDWQFDTVYIDEVLGTGAPVSDIISAA